MCIINAILINQKIYYICFYITTLMKILYSILIIMISFSMMSSNLYASKKDFYDTVLKTEKKKCCQQKEISKNAEQKKCGGKCCNLKCDCITALPIYINLETVFKRSIFSLLLINRIKFPHSIPSISDGFYSIWLLPKIN